MINDRRKYGRTAAITFGWHVGLLALVGLNALMPYEDDSCRDAVLFCFTVRELMYILLAASVPFLAVSLVAALLVAVPLSQGRRSARVAAAWSVLGGILITVTLILLWATQS